MVDNLSNQKRKNLHHQDNIQLTTKMTHQGQKLQFYIKINFNPSLKKEVNYSRFETPENSNRYERLVYRALAQENISISKASSLLGKNIEFVKENYALI